MSYEASAGCQIIGGFLPDARIQDGSLGTYITTN